MATVSRPLAAAFALVLPACASVSGGGEPPLYVDGTAHPGIDAIDFDDDSEVFVSGGWEGRLTLWNTDEPGAIRSWVAHEGWVQGVAFVDRRFIASGGYDGAIRLWDRHGQQRSSVDAGAPVTRMRVMGSQIVTGHADGAVRIWDARTLDRLDEFAVHEKDWVVAIAVHEPSGRIASSGSGGNVYLLGLGRTPRALATPRRKAFGLSFAPDGETLYGSGFRLLYRWRLNGRGDAQLSDVTTPHWGTINGLQYIPHLELIASVSRTNDSSILLLDPESGAGVRKLQRLGLCATELAVSDDGRFLASAGEDGPLRLWQLDRAGPQQTASN
ncbi:MAG: WD40 repeat domain-containing protein [Gammaproteobacteria bacterium]